MEAPTVPEAAVLTVLVAVEPDAAPATPEAVTVAVAGRDAPAPTPTTPAATIATDAASASADVARPVEPVVATVAVTGSDVPVDAPTTPPPVVAATGARVVSAARSLLCTTVNDWVGLVLLDPIFVTVDGPRLPGTKTGTVYSSQVREISAT